MRIKRIIGFIMACLIIMSSFVISGYAEKVKYEDTYPLIILPGINHSVSYLANEDGTPYINSEGVEVSGGLLVVDTDGLVGRVIKNLLYPLLSSIALQCDNGLSEAAYETVCDIMKLQTCDKEGNQIYNLKTETYNYPISQMDEETKKWFYVMLPIQKVTNRIGEDNVYLYTFPLVGDPMNSAENLKSYIEMVKEQKHVDKVNIATVSLGGTILTAYADIVKDWSNVNSIINVVSCLNGSDIFADFYAREWNLDADFLYKDYLRQIMKQSNGSQTLGCVINTAIRLLSKDTVYSLLTGAFSGVLDSLFINDAQFWAMMPRERYDELSQRYLSGEDYAVLKEKTDKFQNARLNLEKNLKNAAAQGVSINNICGSDLTYSDGDYGFLGIVKSSATCNSDGIVPVYSASIGAKTVPVGTEFSQEYISNVGTKYISAFRSVDASTCLFPDHVWFFQKQHHEVGTNDAVMELLARIATGEIEDIYSSEEFPQYMYSRYTKTLTRWLLPQAEEVMLNEDGKYTQEQINEVEKAYNEAKEAMSDYSIGGEKQYILDNVASNLDEALVNAGRREKTKETSKFDEILEKIFIKIDDEIFSVFGDHGFFDWNGIGKINQKIFG